MPEETQTQQIKTELYSEKHFCTNSKEPEKSDLLDSDKGVFLKKDNKAKKCPPASYGRDCPGFEPCPGKLPEVRYPVI